MTDLTLSNAFKVVEFSISTVTCSRAGAKETETARRCTLELGGGRVRSMSHNCKIQLQRNGGKYGGYGGMEI